MGKEDSTHLGSFTCNSVIHSVCAAHLRLCRLQREEEAKLSLHSNVKVCAFFNKPSGCREGSRCRQVRTRCVWKLNAHQAAYGVLTGAKRVALSLRGGRTEPAEESSSDGSRAFLGHGCVLTCCSEPRLCACLPIRAFLLCDSSLLARRRPAPSDGLAAHEPSRTRLGRWCACECAAQPLLHAVQPWYCGWPTWPLSLLRLLHGLISSVAFLQQRAPQSPFSVSASSPLPPC